jgi:dolichyl-phosphate-mannose-protein mannosyltransferase
MLLFCTTLCVYCLSVSRNLQRTEPLSEEWFWWMCFTGVSLGVVLSVKWVGLFAIALVGLHTVEDLWEMLGNVKMSFTTYAKHWAARIVFLIAVPVLVYMLSFWLHFLILSHSGPGDAQMSSLFQAQLRGNSFDDNPLEVAYGSIITVKNNARGGALLHSHVQAFPTGSKQQQVTCYHHKDSNNEFRVAKSSKAAKATINETTALPEDGAPLEFLKDGDVLRLQHVSTGRHLHSHRIRAPLTAFDNEVSGYGGEEVFDPNDDWKLEKVGDLVGSKSSIVHSLTTRFRLRHVVTGCLLRSSGKTLPEWGFKQTEVTCQRLADNASEHNIWNVEKHVNEKLPAGGTKKLRQGFLRSFVDLNVAMW